MSIMKEIDTITKAQCLKCKFLSDEFYQMLRLDYPFKLEIDKYNKKNHSSLSFEEYILKNSDCLYNFLWSRTNYAKHPSSDNVYTFIFHLHVGTTNEDIQNAINADNSVLLNDRWINSDKWGVQEGDISVDEFLANVRKAKMLKTTNKRKKGHKIEKYDKDWKLICVYKDRQECIDAEKITKAALSMHLSGKRKSLNGFHFVETKE